MTKDSSIYLNEIFIKMNKTRRHITDKTKVFLSIIIFRKDFFFITLFKYDAIHFKENEEGVIICPYGKPMKIKTVINHEDGHSVTIYEGTECKDCPFHDKCTKGGNRTISLERSGKSSA